MACQRVIMIPGMGADERLFRPQLSAGLEFEIPQFTVPEPRDTMATYAARIRDALRLDGPCIVGGVSFGGMIACELAHLCPASRVLLVASCCSGDAIRRWYVGVELFSRLLPDALIKRRCEASSRFLAMQESLNEEQYHLVRDMSLDVPIPFLRRVGRMILSWKARPCPVPLYHIHGDHDKIIPLARVSPDEIIPGGGHLINLTHADDVNAFLRRHIAAECPSSQLDASSTA